MELEKKYRTIVADPPWEYPEGFAFGPGHGRLFKKPLPYPSMTIYEIKELPVSEIAEKNARLFLWTTNKWLPNAFDVISAWGFRYRQILVWHKPDANFPSHIAPNSAEFLLVAIKGKPSCLGKLSSSVFSITRRGEHSTKPECFLDFVEQVSPGPYLELFARRNRLGWDTWGNQALNHTEAL